MHAFWRLSEFGPDNLGLACTNDGLVLGRTPLIERRDERFVVRERNEIERLLKKAFPQHTAVDRLMPGLATVASALNASDACLARIAAVHLKIPDLPSLGARRGMEIEDRLIKSVDWNPDLHPRTGTPPNPAGSRRPEVRTAMRQSKSRKTTTQFSIRTHLRVPMTIGLDCRGESASKNSVIFSNGWQTRHPAMRRGYARRSSGIITTLAIPSAATRSTQL